MNPFKHRLTRTRRAGSIGAMLVTLLLSVLGLTQCRMADQTITGVDAPSATHGRPHRDCRFSCWVKFKSALKHEAVRYRRAKHECGRDRECLAKQRREHEQNLRSIVEQLKKCKSECYSEGSGRGGRDG